MNVVRANGPGSGTLIGRSVRVRAYSNSSTAPMPWGTPTGPVVSCTERMSSDIGPILRSGPASRSPVMREANAQTKLARRISPSLMMSRPGLHLIGDGPVDRVVERLGDVGRAEPVGFHELLGGVEPRRVGVAPDHRGRQQRQVRRHRPDGTHTRQGASSDRRPGHGSLDLTPRRLSRPDLGHPEPPKGHQIGRSRT